MFPLQQQMTQINIENQQETMIPSIQILQQTYLILLVNSRSGSCLGDALVKSHISQIKIKGQEKRIFFIEVFDLYEVTERAKAFQKAQQQILAQKTVHIVICGGDGTVEWVIDESLKSGIDLEGIAFAVLPIGTGNDFAQSIGWGDFIFQLTHQKFQEFVKQICKCKVGSFDIWQSTIQCFQSGSIIEIKNGQEVEREEKTLTKNFTNYFGIGTDAQICYIAQKLKAKTKCLKRIAYGFAGIISFFLFCGGIKRKIAQILQSNSDQEPKTNNELTESQIQPQTKEQLLLKVDISRFDGCITFINTTSSMDLKGVWQTPHLVNSEKLNFKQQSVNDGLIEIVSYRNEISLMLERVFHMAKRVGQGNGPFMINFKQPKVDELHSVYIHINGEPYKVINIKSIVVLQSSKFPSGKIKVLYRPK